MSPLLLFASHYATLKLGATHVMRTALTIGLVLNYLAPGGGCEVLFSPGLSVCVSVCLSVCVCVYLCVRPIFWYFISRLLEEISI